MKTMDTLHTLMTNQLFIFAVAIVLFVMAITLADVGYEVSTAPDGDTTMSLCRTNSKAVPRRAVFRSSFPGHCTRRPGLGRIRSRPCHRDPACSFAPYQTKRNGLQAVA